MSPVVRRLPSSDSSNVSAGKKKKKKTLKITAEAVNLAGEHITDYLRSANIHGVKYIGEQRRHIAEKLFWAVLFLLSIWVCTLLILKVWDKWENASVIVTFAESTTPVWQFPFPAVTVCSETKVKATLFNYTYTSVYLESEEGISESELVKLRHSAHVCTHHYLDGENTTDESTLDFIAEVAPSLEEMVWFSLYREKSANVSQVFSPTLTENGICYTFNALDAKEIFTTEGYQEGSRYLNHGKESEGWSLELGYSRVKDVDTYPRRALGVGTKAGLNILLRTYSQDLDILCKGPVFGYKIYLHTPGEIPRVDRKYFQLSLNQEMVLSVKPNMMTTSEGLRDYKPHRRKCYFPSERSLMFFRVYTQNNCEFECLTNFTYNYCGCVAFHMPRTNSTPICSLGSKLCKIEANNKMTSQEIENVLTSSESGCDCLPECSALQYDAEASTADFHGLRMMDAYQVNTSSDEFNGINVARVVVYLNDDHFTTLRRSEFYGQTDFLAYCGGLLGLFMGFSILSLVEFIYYFTMRIFCNVMKKRARMSSRTPSLQELQLI